MCEGEITVRTLDLLTNTKMSTDCADAVCAVILPFMSPITKRSWILVDIVFLPLFCRLHTQHFQCKSNVSGVFAGVYTVDVCLFERVNTMCTFVRYSVL